MSEKITQKIAIAAPPADIFEQLLVWGESVWWPAKCLMHFENLSGFIGEDTVYRQKVKAPLGPSWRSRNEVVDRKSFYIKRVFSQGMFEGLEEVRLEPAADGAQAVYSFCIEVKGWLNRFVWQRWGRRSHKKNINRVLVALKQHVEGKCA